MKKLMLFAVCLMSLQMAQAQFKFGVRGGITTADVNPGELLITNRENFQDLKLSVSEANYGIHFGLFTQIQMGKFFIQPEAIFNSNSVDFRAEDLNNVSDILTEKYQYLDIPFMMGIKMGPLRLQGGPVGHLFVNSKSDLFDIQGYDQNFDRMTYGWQAGVGLDIWKFVLDFKYEGNFNNFGDHIVFNDRPYAFDDTPGRMVFSLGVAF
ncbi:MAG: porin family protein [Bacteroidota bacterium]